MNKKAILALLLAFSAPLAWAYLPPSLFIVQMIARKHSGYKAVEVQTLVSAVDNGKPGATRFRDTTVFVPSTGALRSWALDSNGTVLYFAERDVKSVPVAGLLLLDGHPARLSESLKDAGIPVVIPSASPSDAPNAQARPYDVPTSLENTAAAEKQEPEKMALKRLDPTVAWVIGEEQGPQLWIEKDSFLPVRLLLSTADIRMENYHFFSDFPYPQKVTAYEPSKKDPFLIAELLSLHADSRADGGSALPKEEPGQGARETMTEAGNSSPSDLRDLIKAYYKVLR